MLGTVTDISERKRAEATLKARERELQSLADNSPDILSRFDRELRYVFVNAAVERMTGAPPGMFAGRTFVSSACGRSSRSTGDPSRSKAKKAKARPSP